jgi:hypothetical protein
MADDSDVSMEASEARPAASIQPPGPQKPAAQPQPTGVPRG